jgi:alanyl-tRNA synthetase
MDTLGLNEIRKMFLEFFRKKGHLVLPSFSLIPEKDKSLLLINSGMAPLKPYFTMHETPPEKRVTTCQKCIRTPDIERVGKTSRHGTFFEMLGNFSFGDYFKKEAVAWAWEFVTKDLKLPVDRLWVTIYQDDEEAFNIWNTDIGLPKDRIVRLGKEHNFWEIGVGPCGPCSEIYYDMGEDVGCKNPDCAVGCDCDRFTEFWNLVFTQYNKDEEGNYHPLSNPSIDTGMGLERIAAIVQGAKSIFEVDSLRNIMACISSLANAEYGEHQQRDISLRVITDHIRSITFMVSDGILPSNEGRGYVLRRILRRAARHGKLLGIENRFLSEAAEVVIKESCGGYPELYEKKDYILKVIQLEEERFQDTINQGLLMLNNYIDEMKEKNIRVFPGDKAFRLYDTYGFPLDLTREILEEKDMSVDESSFAEEMHKQSERARSARQTTDYMGADDQVYNELEKDASTTFRGYDTLSTESVINYIYKDNKQVEEVCEGDEVYIILDQTPFYGESGGQTGDIGILENSQGVISIDDTQMLRSDLTSHKGTVKKGKFRKGDIVTARVDNDFRIAVARNHTTTHLVHKALRELLGRHVEQSGSLVSSDRLRFDFSHFSPMSSEEIAALEQEVNYRIMENLKVEAKETSFNEAKELGAAALFGEKYGEFVRVIKIGDYSMELCGGTHLSYTGQTGMFKVVSETGIAAGVRRIEAVTGMGTYNLIREQENILDTSARELKVSPSDLPNRIKGLLKQLKDNENEINHMKDKLANQSIDSILDTRRQVGDVWYISAQIDDQDAQGLRNMADLIRDKMKSGLVVLASEHKGKVIFIAAATKDVIKKGVHSGNILKEVARITGGGGGGRPDMAQAGAKDRTKIKDALDSLPSLLEQQLGINN